MGEPEASELGREGDHYGANMGQKWEKMSHQRPEWRSSRGRGTRRGGSPIGAAPEGDQALQILHDRSQSRLIFDPLSTPPASSSEAMFLLPLRKDVLATDAELAAHRIAARPMDLSHAVPRLDLLHLSRAGSLALQTEGPVLPVRHVLRGLIRSPAGWVSPVPGPEPCGGSWSTRHEPGLRALPDSLIHQALT